MSSKRWFYAVPALVLALGFRMGAPAQTKFLLTIDNIMRGPELYGYEPNGIRWSGDSERIYFRWKQASDPPLAPRDTYVVNRDGTGLRKLTDEEARLAPPVSGDYTRDRRRVVYAQDGDIYLYDFTTGTCRQLTKTEDKESDPQFTQDEKRVAFTRGDNLYVMSLDTGLLEQMTDIQPASAKSAEPKLTASQEFLKKQEKELIGAVREREAREAAQKARRQREHPRKPFELQAGQTISDLELCPSEKCVIATVTEGAKQAKRDNVQSFVTESGYTEQIPGRTAVGDTQPRTRVAILDAATGDVKWVDLGLGNREADVDEPLFNEQGTHAALLARATDNKDRWIMALDLDTAKTRVLFTDHDDAWLDGPGADTLGFLKDGDGMYFESERDGYAHLYTVSFAGGEPRQLTSGKFAVTDVDLSKNGTKFYLTTSEVGPAQREFYSMGVDGGKRTRITRMAGGHQVVLSPDEKYIADVYSYTNKPPEIYVGENHPGASEQKLTNSPSAEFWNYPWLDVPIVHVPARDGVMIPAHFYKPANYKPGGPAVIFVHGAGYLQNVEKFWSPYPREYMFNHFLMEHGYMVLDMDYRGSAGYGRDWRTAIYRHMGGKDLDDNVDGAKWLVKQGADPKRIGIYGGSYGGFITLMAMFKTPGVFAAGAALRPVSDWSHYNNGYTSDILNLPQNDAQAYKESSPIYYANGLQGALLICHGMVDTNVFFQDTVRLVQKLIELHKENWSVAIYPVENHGFVHASSWSDEYKRIFNLFETNLKNGRS